jgi:hypothetical protein
MAIANPLWRAPRIHGELKMLGITVYTANWECSAVTALSPITCSSAAAEDTKLFSTVLRTSMGPDRKLGANHALKLSHQTAHGCGLSGDLLTCRRRLFGLRS